MKTYFPTSKKTFLFVLAFLAFLDYSAKANPEWMSFKSDAGGLADSPVYQIVIDDSLKKWCRIFENAGVYILNDTSWNHFDSYNAFILYDLSSISIDKENKFWGAYRGGIVNFDGLDLKFFDTTNAEFPIKYSNAITVDKLNNKWFWTDKGLVKYDNLNWELIDTTNSSINKNYIHYLASDFNGNIWLASDSTFYKFDGANWTAHSLAELGLADHINYITIDKNGNLWLALKHSVVKYSENEFQQFVTDIPELYQHVYSFTGIAFDDNNDLWISGYGFLLIKFDGKTWTKLNSDEPNFHNGGRSLCVTTDKLGNIWLGLQFGSICVYRPGGVILDVQNETANLTEKSLNISIEPNPLSKSGTLGFDLPEQAEITIKIYDEAGNEVKTLLKNEITAPGNHSISFDCSDLCAGVYVCSVFKNNSVYSRKLIIN